MLLTIHRGAHEIGGSCVELQSQNTRLIIDIGMPLVDKSGGPFEKRKYQGLTGPELVKQGILPDIPGFYRWDDKTPPVDGILISHPHLDHYGFYGHLRPDVRFYMGEASRKIIDLTALFTGLAGQPINHTRIQSGLPFSIGSFRVTPFLMDHSAFDSYAFLLEAEGKKIFYSGDFREHGRKKKAFDWFLLNGPEKVDALLMEGTMLGRQGEKVMTEKEIEQQAVALARKARNAILIYASSQNIDRLVSFYRASLQTGKTFIIDFYTANILQALAGSAKIPCPGKAFPNLRVFYPFFLAKKMVDAGHGDLLYRFRQWKITKPEITSLGNKAMVMVRPSMMTDLNRIGSLENGTFIYSLWDGYLHDKAMERLRLLIDRKKMDFHQLHTSGHADRKTLAKMARKLKPGKIIPIHTFHPDQYAAFGYPVQTVPDKTPVNI